MELPTIENSQPTPNSSDVEAHHDHDNLFPQLSDANGGGETDHKLSAEEVKGVLEIIASTGKFWHDWDELRSMLIFQLKQVLSEYPGAQISEDQQNCYLGETFLQLAKNLEEALVSFIEGPPFTLQRLCEILLNARTIYPNLSKLALALEKNLLVTSTLTKSLDPYPPSTVQLEDASEKVEDVEPLPESSPFPPHSNPMENGGEPMTGEKDEVMSEVEAEAEAEAESKAEADGGMTIDMETFEEIISSSETNPQSNSS